jgi:hypothetical protein
MRSGGGWGGWGGDGGGGGNHSTFMFSGTSIIHSGCISCFAISKSSTVEEVVSPPPSLCGFAPDCPCHMKIHVYIVLFSHPSQIP